MPHATSPPGEARPQVLFIDAHDSFTNNIISLLETQIGVQITLVHIDSPIPDLSTFLKPFVAVVAGPGPGDPRHPKDVGLIGELWKLTESRTLLPALGICLGFQSLVLSLGGAVERLTEPRHGVVRKIRSSGRSVFRGREVVESVQYHSLHASLGHSSFGEDDSDIWEPSSNCPDLVPLAYDFESDNSPICSSQKTSPTYLHGRIPATEEDCLEDGEYKRYPDSGCPGCEVSELKGDGSSSLSLTKVGKSSFADPILMAVEHTTKPFVGLQFHPESIYSSESARSIITSWWDSVRGWNLSNRPIVPVPRPALFSSRGKTPKSAVNDIRDSKLVDQVMPIPEESFFMGNNRPSFTPCTRAIDASAISVPAIIETLRLSERDFVLLDSEMHQMQEVGQYSIIGLIESGTVRFEYKVGRPKVRLTSRKGLKEIVELEPFGGNVFSYLKRFMAARRIRETNSRVPFSGGLVGYINYDACLETLRVKETPTTSVPERSWRRPDISLAFVERSIGIDHSRKTAVIQSIKQADRAWVTDTAALLQKHALRQIPPPHRLPHFNARITLPDENIYKSQVRTCQSFIRAGDSYELCLTTQAIIKTSIRLDAWPLYQRLRNLNPSPFSAYLRLGDLTLLSSSPERFLRWSRPTTTRGYYNSDRSQKTSVCQFRPIKGTVKRQPNPNLPSLTLAEATALLSTPKERAENLMIVDLIRHDLYGVIGSGRVTVPKLMVVEEYATLFQLVSVVEGSLIGDEDGEDSDATNFTQAGLTPGHSVLAPARKYQTFFGNHNPTASISPDGNPFTTSETLKPHTKTPSTTFNSPITTTPTASPHLSNHYRNPPLKSGIDVLAASLPPGSMTGAPKLRSCQLLKDTEQRDRGVYSGIVGYMDVGGGGDWSVVIRSAFRWDGGGDGDGDSGETDVRDDEVGGEIDVPSSSSDRPRGSVKKDGDEETWTIGAGGAVTALSTADGEWEEMLAKLGSTLRLFEGGDADVDVDANASPDMKKHRDMNAAAEGR